MIDYGLNHPLQVLAVAGSCNLPASDRPRVPIAFGAAGGLGYYGVQHTVRQLENGKSPLEDINLDQAAG